MELSDISLFHVRVGVHVHVHVVTLHNSLPKRHRRLAGCVAGLLNLRAELE